MEIREVLRKKNRTVLEMNLGILALGAVLQIISAVLAEAVPQIPEAGDNLLMAAGFPKSAVWSLSLLLGTGLALLAVRHMYRTLDVALDLDEGNAQKMIYRGYVMRYLVLVALILFLIGTKLLNPLLVFLSYMSLKGTVYLQPFTHKLCNKYFHETDPVPQPEPEEESLETSSAASENGTEE